MSELVPIRRALLSVSDKSDLIPFATALHGRGVELVSTGGTAKALVKAGLPVIPIDAVTGFPEIMDGRVKTLHPNVHGALLGVRDNEAHTKAMREHGMTPIDLVCINLYPFAQTIAKPEVSLEEAIEQIDIGGPAMIRAAAKNHRWVTVVTSPKRYDELIRELDENNGATTMHLRMRFARAAFAQTSEYDAAISAFLARRSPEPFPETLRLTYSKVDELRYGENPHQSAAVYADAASTGPSVVGARQLHGKPMSYNNYLDAASALEAVKMLGKLDENTVGACVVKHTTPCGLAVGSSCAEAVDHAIKGDPLAAYGGILAVNKPIDKKAAERIAAKECFFEVVIAPSFEGQGLELLRERWANVRLLAAGDRDGSVARKLDYRSIPGGMLVQDRDVQTPTPSQWAHKAGPEPSEAQVRAAAVLEVACRQVGSNAAVIGGLDPETGVARLFGVGGGQVDRVTACRIAVEKAGELCKGAIAVSDAFFPFDDGPGVLVEAGVKMIVHPGGSKRDEDTFTLCEKHGVTCMTTGMRRFRH